MVPPSFAPCITAELACRYAGLADRAARPGRWAWASTRPLHPEAAVPVRRGAGSGDARGAPAGLAPLARQRVVDTGTAVPRRHGTLEYRAGCWWVRALGGRPVRLGRTQELWRGDEPVPLADGRTSLQVEGANTNEVHVMRVEVVGRPAPPRPPEYCGGTTEVHCYRLGPAERLVMTVVASACCGAIPAPRS